MSRWNGGHWKVGKNLGILLEWPFFHSWWQDFHAPRKWMQLTFCKFGEFQEASPVWAIQESKLYIGMAGPGYHYYWHGNVNSTIYVYCILYTDQTLNEQAWWLNDSCFSSVSPRLFKRSDLFQDGDGTQTKIMVRNIVAIRDPPGFQPCKLPVQCFWRFKERPSFSRHKI